MTTESILYIAESVSGKRLIDISSRETFFNKKTISPEVEKEVRNAIQHGSQPDFEAIVLAFQIMQLSDTQSHLFTGSFLKTNGFLVVPIPQMAPCGAKADLTLTVRTASPLAYSSKSASARQRSPT